MNSLPTTANSFRLLTFLLATFLIALTASAASADEAETVAVDVVAESGAWPTDEPIEQGLLPIKVRIDNHTDRPLKLRYEDLALVGFSGDRYFALPIHNVLLAGTESGKKAKDKISVEVPKFAQVSFRIAPSYSEIFPNSEAFPSHFDQNRTYTEYHRSQWDPELKPTLEMFSRLLPEGVLGAGGYVSGFLYFQEVEGWERGLRLEMAVVRGDQETASATVNVPVTPAEER
jgi:hypothetical protein